MTFAVSLKKVRNVRQSVSFAIQLFLKVVISENIKRILQQYYNKVLFLGIAIIDSICWKYKSSGVVEDRGLTGAFTIAHEIGHT